MGAFRSTVIDMHSMSIRNRARELRRNGMTYSEIRGAIGIPLAKATLSYWLHDIVLDPTHEKRIIALNAHNLAKGRKIRIQRRKKIRKKIFFTLREEFLKPIQSLSGHQKKLLLAILYLGEGGKLFRRAAVMFGNSDPKVIRIFLRLMRSAYAIDESKIRCTVQCRADQDIRKLENYWSQVASVPLENFYKAQIDKRSIGKPTRRANYLGVLRIDYFSASIFHELMNLSDILNEGL